MQHGPSTAAELADRLRLTAAGIRRHLAALTEEGMVEARDQRVYGARGRGRPAKVFALTDRGRADFPQGYDELALQALRFLSERDGSKAVRELAGSRVATIEKRYREVLAEREDADPAEALAAVLSENGYIASTRPAVAGVQVCQHHCPVAQVAEQFPELCEVETEAFARLLGVHVQRLATIAHGDGVCTTHVPLPPEEIRIQTLAPQTTNDPETRQQEG